ncbi:hypothetical protein BD779DRAFT_1670377 [Infundibulicybe gibba]|nr:hypothetical protein BD779DRAFT_1670377 [Infundibulicybe gibba]
MTRSRSAAPSLPRHIHNVSHNLTTDTSSSPLYVLHHHHRNRPVTYGSSSFRNLTSPSLANEKSGAARIESFGGTVPVAWDHGSLSHPHPSLVPGTTPMSTSDTLPATITHPHHYYPTTTTTTTTPTLANESIIGSHPIPPSSLPVQSPPPHRHVTIVATSSSLVPHTSPSLANGGSGATHIESFDGMVTIARGPQTTLGPFHRPMSPSSQPSPHPAY